MIAIGDFSFSWSSGLHYLLLYQSALSAGWLSGSLHALTGSDHLASLLPVIVARRWYISGLYGAVWGLGHGLCSAMVGYSGFLMRGLVLQKSSLLDEYRFVGDLVVAMTVLVVGGMGVYEARQEALEVKDHSNDNSQEDFDLDSLREGYKVTDVHNSDEELALNKTMTHISGVYTSSYRMGFIKITSVLLNGLVLGLSLDGLPSLAPAIMLDDWLVLCFLLSYLLSTLVTMAFATAIIGESSYWISYHTQRHQSISVSTKLAWLSSINACCIGSCWMVLALFKAYRFFTTPLDNDNFVFPPNNDFVVEAVDNSTANLWLSIGSFFVIIFTVVVTINRDICRSPSSNAFHFSCYYCGMSRFHLHQHGYKLKVERY